MNFRIAFNEAFKQYLGDCVHQRRPLDSMDEVWVPFSNRASKKLNAWSVQKHNVALTSENWVAWLRFGVSQISHIVAHRANHNVPATDVLNLLEACLLEGALTFSPNDSGGGSAKRYPNQVIAFIPSIKSKSQAIHGQSPCIVIELVKLPTPHFNLITAYWSKQNKITAFQNNAM